MPHFHLQTAAVLALGLSYTSQALRFSEARGATQVRRCHQDDGSTTDSPVIVTILADTNRDGRIDEADITGKETWTRQSGALILANIADTDGRCSSMIQRSTPNAKLDQCHDASDNILRNPKYLAPFRTTPCPLLSNSTTGFLAVSDGLAASMVRVFHKQDNNWIYVLANYTFSAADLRLGLELGIDARDVRRPGAWDGRGKLKLTVRDGAAETQDSVAFRVAPILTHHHGQLAEQVLTHSGILWGEKTGQQNDKVEGKFVADLMTKCSEVGVDEPVYQLTDAGPDSDPDIWVQDFFEPGYMSIPGPDGPTSLRIMIRSAQDWRENGRQIFKHLRSGTAGAVQFLASGETTDSLGNLETIPPYAYNGKSYPAGRAVMGSQHGVAPKMMTFLKAQEEQDPIDIDTSWLYVGHTDEFLQFLPARNSTHGWVLMVSDPMAALELLRGAQEAGHGGSKAVSRPRFVSDDEYSPGCLSTGTVDRVLDLPSLASVQRRCADAIRENIDIIKRETGITDRDIIGVPTLYYNDGKRLIDGPCNYDLGKRDEADGQGRKEERGKPVGVRQLRRLSVLEAGTPPGHLIKRKPSTSPQVSAYYPGAVNGIVLSDTEVLVPNPWGPVINGKDIIATVIRAAYARADYTVLYMDDWFSHHLGSGEVHCGTNTIRDMTARWW